MAMPAHTREAALYLMPQGKQSATSQVSGVPTSGKERTTPPCQFNPTVGFPFCCRKTKLGSLESRSWVLHLFQMGEHSNRA